MPSQVDSCSSFSACSHRLHYRFFFTLQLGHALTDCVTVFLSAGSLTMLSQVVLQIAFHFAVGVFFE